MRFDERTAALRFDPQPQHEVGGCEQSAGFFRPFDEADRIAPERFVESCIENFLWKLDTIQIKVI